MCKNEWVHYRGYRWFRLKETIRYSNTCISESLRGKVMIKKGRYGCTNAYSGNDLYCSFGTFQTILNRSKIQFIPFLKVPLFVWVKRKLSPWGIPHPCLQKRLVS